jgi:hypothetical protein
MILRAINQECEPRRIEPSSDDVVRAVQALDGRTRTLVILEVSDDHHMGIGGGGGGYIVYMTVDNQTFKNLVIAGKTGPKISLICGGQEGEFAAKQCVDLPTAQRAAEAFANDGQADPTLNWEDG